MAVDAELAGVREVRRELQKERPEIVVHAIEVELIDHPGRFHDPRVGRPIRVAALLGAEHRVLLLRPTDEYHPLGRSEAPEVFGHHVVLALTFHEIDPRDAFSLGEAMHRPNETVTDPCQWCRRSDRQPELAVHIAEDAAHMLQPRLVDIQEHPVDALHLEVDVISKDISHSARYRHDGLRFGIRRPPRPTTATEQSYTRPASPSRVILPDRSPRQT